MSQEENLRKLNKELQKDIKEECQIICIMSRIRKTLEQHEDSLRNEYSLLKFYCNWTLHPKINGISGMEEVFEKFTKAHKNQEIDAGLDFISFKILQEEMKRFFEKFNLKDIKVWESFKKFLLDVLIDCPLKPRIGPIKFFAFKRPKFDLDDIDFEIKFYNDIILYKGSLAKPINFKY